MGSPFESKKNEVFKYSVWNPKEWAIYTNSFVFAVNTAVEWSLKHHNESVVEYEKTRTKVAIIRGNKIDESVDE